MSGEAILLPGYAERVTLSTGVEGVRCTVCENEAVDLASLEHDCIYANDLVADGGEAIGRSPEQEIASDQLDMLSENPERCAQVSVHAGRHPYVRWNDDVEAYEIAEQGFSNLDVQTCTKDALLNLFAENPVDVMPLRKATYSPDEPGMNNVWKAIEVRDERDDIIYTERHQ